eukprot:UN00696
MRSYQRFQTNLLISLGYEVGVFCWMNRKDRYFHQDRAQSLLVFFGLYQEGYTPQLFPLTPLFVVFLHRPVWVLHFQEFVHLQMDPHNQHYDFHPVCVVVSHFYY